MPRIHSKDRADRHLAEKPNASGIVALVNGVAMSIAAVYVMTASAVVTTVVGVLAVVVVGLFLALYRR
jgi:hypothetical protein